MCSDFPYLQYNMIFFKRFSCKISLNSVTFSKSNSACLCLNIKPEQHNIAVLDYIFFAFRADEAFFLGGIVAAAIQKILIVDNFGTDEAPLEIGVDFSGSLGRFRAHTDCPGSGLGNAGCEVTHEAQDPVAGGNQFVQA